MAVGIIKHDVFKCERCGYEWFSHKYTAENPPIACAKCKAHTGMLEDEKIN